MFLDFFSLVLHIGLPHTTTNSCEYLLFVHLCDYSTLPIYLNCKMSILAYLCFVLMSVPKTPETTRALQLVVSSLSNW